MNKCFKIKNQYLTKKGKKSNKDMKGLNKQICFNNMMERKQLQTKPSGRFILWQPINFEILACSYFFIFSLSSYIFWIRNKQKQRINWKQTHWFLVEQSSTNLKSINLLNICVYKLSFCYFCHDEIYFLHENFQEFSLEGFYKT